MFKSLIEKGRTFFAKIMAPEERLHTLLVLCFIIVIFLNLMQLTSLAPFIGRNLIIFLIYSRTEYMGIKECDDGKIGINISVQPSTLDILLIIIMFCSFAFKF